ncbi:MAG: EamA family transporter RarD [Candidatus Eisenbacteria bacterium]|nr:EamA family transporter RarD [Candidatus Eisenbacteria bacterium]
MSKGVLYGIAAYGLWGIFPIYWKALQSVRPEEILCHRTIWSLLFLVPLLVYRKRLRGLMSKLGLKIVLIFALTAGILFLNWYLFIWAVNGGHILDASLGYFINPLVSVLLGIGFLRERPRRWQWVAISLVGVAVVVLTVGYGVFPWIALVLAVSFGIYGYLRKIAVLSSLEGLSLEVALLFVPALVFLLYLERNGQAAFGHTNAFITALLVAAGVVTPLPLLLFASAARRITLTNLGFLQYISPTFQLILGVALYGEKLPQFRAIGFALVWASIAVYTIDVLVARRRVTVCEPAPA